MSTTLANLIRSIHGNLSRKELKVLRAKLRRAGVTNLNHARRNAPYAVDASTVEKSDARAEGGAIVVQVVAMVRDAA
jgi:hypothetical protein